MSGSYEVDVSLFGASITNAPFTVLVAPAALAIQNSVITQHPPSSDAGSRAYLSVSARDAFRNKLVAFNIQFGLSAASSAAPIPGPTSVSQSYVGSGEYSVIFVATVAGLYSMALTLPLKLLCRPRQLPNCFHAI